jgi:hypothetical protein
MTKTPLDVVGWLSTSGHQTIVNEKQRRKEKMTTSKCACGSWTDFGTSCVSCSMAGTPEPDFQPIDLEDAFVTEDDNSPCTEDGDFSARPADD